MWVAGLVSAIASEAVRFNDSPDYVPGAGPVDIGVISLTGGAIRAWPTVVMFGLVGGDHARIVLQAVLFLAAWTLLLWAFLAHVRPLRALLVGGVLVVFALSPVVFQWNLAILSESLTISLLVAGLGLVRLGLGSGTGAAVWSWLAFIAIALASVNKFPLVVLLVAVIIMRAGLKIRANRSQPAGSRARSVKWLVVSGIAALALMTYPVLVNSAIDNAWAEQRAAQVTRNAVHYYFLTATVTSLDSAQSQLPGSSIAASRALLARDQAAGDQLFAALPDDAPACLKSNRATLSDTVDPFQYASAQGSACPEGIVWIDDHFLPWYATFVVTHPRYVADVMTYRMPLSLATSTYAEFISIVPPALTLLFTDASLTGVTSFPLAIWIVVGLIALAVLIVRFISGERDEVAIMLATVFVGCAVAWVLTLLMMNAEVYRIAVVSVAPLIATSILLVGHAADHVRDPVGSADDV